MVSPLHPFARNFQFTFRRFLGLLNEAVHHADPPFIDDKQQARERPAWQGATQFP
jgi:hypothetical protein